VAPFLLFFLLFPTEIVRYTLQRGAFSAADTHRTAYALMGFACGLPGLAVSQVAVYAMIAISEWSAAARAGALSVLLDFPISYVLRARMGVAGVTLAASIAASLNSVFLLIPLQKAAGKLETTGWISTVWKLVLSTLAAGAASRATYYLLSHLLDAARYWPGVILLVGSLLAGMGAFAGCGIILRSQELWEVLFTLRHSIREFRLRMDMEMY
jgi:putative peptidoglycan lipid II flippase